MKVLHEVGEGVIKGRVQGRDARLLLTNSRGYYAHPLGNPASTYDGLIQDNWRLIARCSPESEVQSVINKGDSWSIAYRNGVMRGALLKDSLLLEVQDAILDLDIRPLYDEHDEDRNYEVKLEKEILVVHYHSRGEDHFLIIKGLSHYKPIKEWLEVKYSYDKRRGERPSRWIYRLGIVSGNLAVTNGSTLDEAFSRLQTMNLEENKDLEETPKQERNRSAGEEKKKSVGGEKKGLEEDSLTEKTNGVMNGVMNGVTNKVINRITNRIVPGVVQTLPSTPETVLTLRALHTLIKEGRIMAGLPWFSQVWSRDELISVGALIKSGERVMAKKILTKHYLCPPKNAVLGGRRSADAPGWLALRSEELMEEFNDLEKRFMFQQLKKIVEETPIEDGLVVNGPGETWMDTVVLGDDRRGARIEIQALHLAILRFMGKLDSSWKERARDFSTIIKEHFFKGTERVLLDGIVKGLPDERSRPNIFIAAYAAPELLSQKEWVGVFDQLIDKLWLSWGGFSTIEPTNPLFQPLYTGVDDASYHRGDSWYWINALAALVLKRLDAKRYSFFINKLRDACLRDFLWQGALGHSSELSSAAEQEWGGCFAQAWSSAMLYELLAEKSD